METAVTSCWSLPDLDRGSRHASAPGVLTVHGWFNWMNRPSVPFPSLMGGLTMQWALSAEFEPHRHGSRDLQTPAPLTRQFCLFYNISLVYI